MKNYSAGGGGWGFPGFGVSLGFFGVFFVVVGWLVVFCLPWKSPRAFTVSFNKVILSEALILL